MATRKNSVPARSVDDFLVDLDHPLKDEIHRLREVILRSDPSIGESIKWNAPSFHTSEHFATMRLNGKPPLQLILHLGAKKSAIPTGAVQDPGKLLTWLGPDRACVNFGEHRAVATSSHQLQAIIRQWLDHVPGQAT